MRSADEGSPTGDEEKTSRRCWRGSAGIDENIDEADFQSHYVLESRSKRWGCWTKRSASFRRRCARPREAPDFGMLACAPRQGRPTSWRSRSFDAAGAAGVGRSRALGVLYSLGRRSKSRGKKPGGAGDLRAVFAVDIRFKDVGERAGRSPRRSDVSRSRPRVPGGHPAARGGPSWSAWREARRINHRGLPHHRSSTNTADEGKLFADPAAPQPAGVRGGDARRLRSPRSWS